jgi:hypothetical protein
VTGERRTVRQTAVDEVVYTAAGVVDVLLSGAKKGVLRAGRLRKRSDLAHLARAGRDDLKARGSLLMSRFAAGPGPAHLDVLARRVDPPVGGRA